MIYIYNIQNYLFIYLFRCILQIFIVWGRESPKPVPSVTARSASALKKAMSCRTCFSGQSLGEESLWPLRFASFKAQVFVSPTAAMATGPCSRALHVRQLAPQQQVLPLSSLHGFAWLCCAGEQPTEGSDAKALEETFAFLANVQRSRTAG